MPNRSINEPQKLMGVILAAGRGMRAYPATNYTPKVLLEIAGKTLIERNIEILKNKFKIQEIVIVIGYLGDTIKDFLNKIDLEVKLTFVRQEEQKGIGHALLAGEKHINCQQFVVILGDELYIDSNHELLLNYLDQDIDAVLSFKKETDQTKISKNFIGTFQEERVTSLIEKPLNPNTHLMGVGTYLLSQKIFSYIRNTQPSSLRGEVEITNVLSNMAQNEKVLAFRLKGIYLNINTIEDLNYANYLWRDKYFDKYKVSVVIPAYNEEETIEKVIQDFKEHQEVDEVLVIDNNSRDKTNEVSVKMGVRVVKENNQGYGCAIKRGLDEATGDIIILTEADGSFKSKDIPKFLEYLKDCNMAIGTRTTQQMIEQGANMDALLRWGNVLYGKIIEFLWLGEEPRFTDVGCTYRAIWKIDYQKIRPYLHSTGPEFSPEMMVATLICKQRIIEIPVTYYRRFSGESKHSGSYTATLKTAWKMLILILKYRLGIMNIENTTNLLPRKSKNLFSWLH